MIITIKSPQLQPHISAPDTMKIRGRWVADLRSLVSVYFSNLPVRFLFGNYLNQLLTVCQRLPLLPRTLPFLAPGSLEHVETMYVLKVLGKH